jgi:serine/threonine-protein kinase
MPEDRKKPAAPDDATVPPSDMPGESPADPDSVRTLLHAPEAQGDPATTPRRSDEGSQATAEVTSPSPDRYADRGEIGRGGMGTVHRTFDKLLLREIAMKTIEAALTGQAAAEQFVEEAQITGQLDHPNIVPVYDFGTHPDQRTFLTMKLVKGQTLGEAITELHDQGFAGESLEGVLRVLIKVCEAVAFAHSRGVVHRDLKPANIMIGTHGQVYVMDWGLGLLLKGRRGPVVQRSDEANDEVQTSSPGTRLRPALAGTVGYMAPEQAAGRLDAIDTRTDVFALGAILYKTLTGRAPFHSLERARGGYVAPPQELVTDRLLPPALCEITMKALEREPGRRYQSVDALREGLEDFLRGGGWFATRRFQPGQRIVGEGDPAEAAFVVVEGRCEVYQERSEGKQVLRTLGPGDVFGETALLSAQPRTATVAALDEVTVKVVTAEAFERELSHSSWVGALVKQLAARFLELEQKLRGGTGGETE